LGNEVVGDMVYNISHLILQTGQDWAQTTLKEST